jgi:hypothetical protein
MHFAKFFGANWTAHQWQGSSHAANISGVGSAGLTGKPRQARCEVGNRDRQGHIAIDDTHFDVGFVPRCRIECLEHLPASQ